MSIQRPQCALRPIAPRDQRGAIAIVIGLTMFVLIGFAGLALDLGRLFVNKTELQSAADACALAASNELVCDTSVSGGCPAAFLTRAQAAGTYVAGRTSKNFQASSVVIAASDVTFSTVLAPNSNYLSIAGGADVNSKFVMCTARSNGIAPWFMGVLGMGSKNVVAAAVATLSPSVNFCDPAPMGICKVAGGVAPSYGLIPHQWLKSAFSGAKDDITAGGSFQWVDYTAVAGGTPDLREILEGTKHFCGVKVGDTVTENGGKTGTKESYNTRFGLYKGTPGSPTALTAPPDRSGYAYPTAAGSGFNISYVIDGLPASGQASAYGDYRTKQGTSTAYSKIDYPPAGMRKPANEPPPVTDHATYGVQRRVLGAPIIDCTLSSPTILGMGCVLMLNPMGNGSDDLFLEYLGLATAASSPCRTAGAPGGSGGTGPLVPTLVQ